jgi:hypothetical protein
MSGMTRRHFEGIAESLRTQRNLLKTSVLPNASTPDLENTFGMLTSQNQELLLTYHRHLVHILASRLSSYNDAFNYDRFVESALGEFS